MDAKENPFRPGAGSQPPELAGRDDIREKVSVALHRARRGRPGKSCLIVGLRGVGKTVLLNRMMRDAEGEGYVVVPIEVSEERSLPALLAPKLRTALLKISRNARAKDAAQRGLKAVASFAKVFKVKYADIEVGLDLEPEKGLADNGDLETDLTELLETVGRAAQAGETAVVVAMDEIQYLPTDQMAALIMGLHRCVQLDLPITLVGAGLPQLLARLGEAKSYAERLFEFPVVDKLGVLAALYAIVRPIESEGGTITEEAVRAIYAETQGYPYFLQEWGKHAWDTAESFPIRREDVEVASAIAIAELDDSFFRVRLNRLTPMEKKYLQAMAALGPGPYRSGDIAARLAKKLQQVGTIRSGLIDKGMIWSPAYGETDFTVPLFDEFMRRAVMGEEL